MRFSCIKYFRANNLSKCIIYTCTILQCPMRLLQIRSNRITQRSRRTQKDKLIIVKFVTPPRDSLDRDIRNVSAAISDVSGVTEIISLRLSPFAWRLRDTEQRCAWGLVMYTRCAPWVRLNLPYNPTESLCTVQSERACRLSKLRSYYCRAAA